MASFRQRNDTWRAEISVNGIRESATFDTKAQARAWASKRETQLREQSHGKLPDHSFLEAIERYLNEVSIKKKTHENEV
ncbi:site-specific integrase, partial [Acinetobacter baumannii]